MLNLKLRKLFEDHSIFNKSIFSKAPSPITEDNLNVADYFKEKWHPVDHYICIKYAPINGACCIHMWQSLADLTLLSLSAKLVEGCINLLLLPMWVP